MYTVNISAKGQITLPAAIRKRLGVKANDKIALIFRGDEIILKPLKGTIKDLRGALKPQTKPEAFERIRKQVKDAIAQKMD